MDQFKSFYNISITCCLTKIGIKVFHLNTFELYLLGRKQSVGILNIIKNKISFRVTNSKTLSISGLSILGPIMFLCYIKEIPRDRRYQEQG